MFIKLKRLVEIAIRLVPGSHEDVSRCIGECLYCEQPVDYSVGDHTAQGRARHDACESAALRKQLAGPVILMCFGQAVTIVRPLADACEADAKSERRFAPFLRLYCSS